MLKQSNPTDSNDLQQVDLQADLVVVGGGLAGICCSITAARQGLKVVLVQDRPVLGGNASSEVRLWALGATSHMGNNNRWSREGGVIDELIVENLYRNPEGNPVIFDSVLIDKVIDEPNITLLLNTAIFSLEKHDNQSIKLVRGFCSQNSTLYEVSAPLFCDASGDGIVGYLAGAAYRMGAEIAEEFGEKFAPSVEYGSLMGHSIFFYSKDTGKPVKFVPPGFALKDITKIPRYRNFKKNDSGCQLWWIEYGGRLDTVHDTEKIKLELWKIVYGVWNHIKNSGNFPGSETMTLEWVGLIPGKRESRRFEGDYMLVQQDVVQQKTHHDAVSYGGWAIDLHPADGVYSNKPGCDQWHSKGVYQIPYRCMYSRNIPNLFLAGRIISASHVACGSTRVMMTCANNAQAVAVAAAICSKQRLMPRDLIDDKKIGQLQQELLKAGQFIPGYHLEDKQDVVQQAEITASSSFELSNLPADGPMVALSESKAMLVPVRTGAVSKISFEVYTETSTELTCELRLAGKKGNFSPDVVIKSKTIKIQPAISSQKKSGAAQQSVSAKYDILTGANGRMEFKKDKIGTAGKAFYSQTVEVDFETSVENDQYAFVCLKKNPDISVCCTKTRITGLMPVALKGNPRVNSGHLQQPDRDIGVDTMEFWTPGRWPEGHNLAIQVDPPIKEFGTNNLTNGLCRPYNGPNAWVADLNDSNPTLTLKWDSPKTIQRIELSFDTDFDHAMESVLMGHPYNVVPYCVREYRLIDALDRVVYECTDNHQTRNTILLNTAVTTDELHLELSAPDSHIPASLFEIRCYE